MATIIDTNRVIDYLTHNYPSLDNETIVNLANFLLKKGIPTYRILNGGSDKDIQSYLRVVNNSVKKPNEEEVVIPLKTQKKKMSKAAIIALLTGILAISAIFGTGKAIHDGNEQNRIASELGEIASEYESTDTIVRQNMHNIHDMKTGKNSYYYDLEGIADDIIDVIKTNPELLDVCFYNVYFEMEYNRLYNMDRILRNVKSYANQNNMMSIHEELADCDFFLDYLVKKGFLDTKNADYESIMNGVSAYKKTENYFNMSSSDKKEVDKLIDAYLNKGGDIYKSSKDAVKDAYDEGGIKR